MIQILKAKLLRIKLHVNAHNLAITNDVLSIDK